MFPSKIFIDGGLPEETKEASEMMIKQFGKPLDGQTTNPSLIAKNLKSKLGNGQPVHLTQEMALEEYRRIVVEMSSIIPKGSISIQVFADRETKAEEMLAQARERTRWIPNASIKFPCNREGLIAANVACQEMPINITLAFSQSQAAAVYEATKGAKYPVFVSPFVGRLDDRGENGMDVVANILRMYNGHAEGSEQSRKVEVLTASVRNLDHIFYALQLRSNIITIPFKVFQEWSDMGFPEPTRDTSGVAGKREARAMTPPMVKESSKSNLKPIPYREDIVLGKLWQEYDLRHDLTDIGIEKFYSDWMEIVS